MKNDDEDDAPTYVLDDTKESLTKEEYEALVSGKDVKDKVDIGADDVSKDEAKEPDPKQKDKITEVGAGSKKRKAAKIISEEQDQDAKAPHQTDVKVTKKPKKKGKAVKLTFGDEEG
jgi:hypothetical protein